VQSDQKVWKYPYVVKLVTRMEGKYTVMGTGWKALPVGRHIPVHCRHIEIRHI